MVGAHNLKDDQSSGRKNGQVSKNVNCTTMEYNIYNSVQDNNKGSDKKRSSYSSNIPICTKDLQIKELQKNCQVQEESSR